MINRRQRYWHTDWAQYYCAYLLERANRLNRSRDVPQIHQRHQFVNYLLWLHGAARLQLRPTMTKADVREGHSSNEDIVDEYDEFIWMGTQSERAPINAYYGRQLAHICNEAGDVLVVPEGSEGSFQRVRNFVEMVRR